MSGKPAIDDYDVQYRAVGSGTWRDHSFDGAGTETTISVAVGVYQARVRASNDEGTSPWSAPGQTAAQARAGETPPPGKPDAPTVVPDPARPTVGVIVSWDPPTIDGGGITSYDVRHRVQGARDWTTIQVVGTTSAAIGGLRPATTYEARVRAVSEVGKGSWSDSGRGTTQPNTAPGFPSGNVDAEVVENAKYGTVVALVVGRATPRATCWATP